MHRCRRVPHSVPSALPTLLVVPPTALACDVKLLSAIGTTIDHGVESARPPRCALVREGRGSTASVWLEKNDVRVRATTEAEVLRHARGCAVLAYELGPEVPPDVEARPDE